MLPDEKTTREGNLRDLQSAQRMFSQRTADEWSCFESMISLNNAALTILLVDELDDQAVAGLNELLLLQSALMQAAYAHYLLRDKPVTTKSS